MKKLPLLLLTITTLITLFTQMANAQTVIGTYSISGPVSLRAEYTTRGALAAIISNIFLVVLQIVGLIGFLFILWSGYEYLMSKGDPKALQSAKNRLTYSIVGLTVIGSAYAITRLVLSIFGINTP